MASLLPPEGAALEVVAREFDIGPGTLDRGRPAGARDHHSGHQRGVQERPVPRARVVPGRSGQVASALFRPPKSQAITGPAALEGPAGPDSGRWQAADGAPHAQPCPEPRRARQAAAGLPRQRASRSRPRLPVHAGLLRGVAHAPALEAHALRRRAARPGQRVAHRCGGQGATLGTRKGQGRQQDRRRRLALAQLQDLARRLAHAGLQRDPHHRQPPTPRSS